MAQHHNKRNLEHPDAEVRAATLRARAWLSPSAELYARFVTDPAPIVVATALVGQVSYGGSAATAARQRIQQLVDNGSLADIPVESYRRMACTAAIIPIVLNSAGVVVDQGRQIRLANRAQRRALRTMYDTCAIPDCGVRSKHCEPHHIAWWQNGGATDLHNLLPLCSKHHHNVHEDRWKLDMHADRAFTITYPDGHVQTTGPPATARAA